MVLSNELDLSVFFLSVSEPSAGQLHINRAADAKEDQQGIVIAVTWE